MHERQISVTKAAPLLPVNQFLGAEPWVMNENGFKHSKGLLPDFTQTPTMKDGTHEKRSFYRYGRVGIMESIPTTHLAIKPILNSEKNGPRWKSMSLSNAN